MDASREREKLASVSELAGDEMSDYITVLYSLLFELSRAYQGKILGLSSETQKKVEKAVKMLKLLSIWSMLKESGMLKDFL